MCESFLTCNIITRDQRAREANFFLSTDEFQLRIACHVGDQDKKSWASKLACSSSHPLTKRIINPTLHANNYHRTIK